MAAPGSSSSSGTNDKPPADAAPGIRFNAVQRDEPAAVVLTPQVDPALRRRRALFLALAVAAIALLLFVSLNRLGVQTQGGDGGRKGARFGPSPESTNVR